MLITSPPRLRAAGTDITHRLSPVPSFRCCAAFGACCFLLLAASGCREAKVAAYRIPKEQEAALATEPAPSEAPSPAGAATPPHPPMGNMPPLGMPADMAALPVATASAAGGLTWTAPATWQPKALGQMRKGSFTVPGTDGTTSDFSITAFPGAVGGELANVNRWRGQLSLTPITEAELPTATTKRTVGGLTFTVVDLSDEGAQPQRMLGAMVPFGQAMWFFKLSGPSAAVASQRDAFQAFLQTVTASAPTTP